MELNTKRTKEDDNDQAKSESRGGIRRRIRKFVFRLTKQPNDDNRYKSFLVIVAFLSFISLARTREQMILKERNQGDLIECNRVLHGQLIEFDQ